MAVAAAASSAMAVGRGGLAIVECLKNRENLPHAVELAAIHLQRGNYVLGVAKTANMPSCFYTPLEDALATFSARLEGAVDAQQEQGSSMDCLANFLGTTVGELQQMQKQVAIEAQMVMANPMYAKAGLTNMLEEDQRDDALEAAEINRTMVAVGRRQGLLIRVDKGDEDNGLSHKVLFHDGQLPDADWFKKRQIRVLTLEEVHNLSFPCVLIIGGTGEGKSTLINMLKDDSSPPAEVGLDLGGVTKTENFYRATAPKSKRKFFMMDLPGLGDEDVDVSTILALVDVFLGKRVFDAAVFVHELGKRFDFALQILLPLFEKSVKGGAANVMLALTKADKQVDLDDQAKSKLINGSATMFQKMFKQAPTHCLAVSNKEKDAKSVRELLEAIEGMMGTKILWSGLTAEAATEVFLKLCGQDAEKAKEAEKTVKDMMGKIDKLSALNAELEEKMRAEIEAQRQLEATFKEERRANTEAQRQLEATLGEEMRAKTEAQRKLEANFQSVKDDQEQMEVQVTNAKKLVEWSEARAQEANMAKTRSDAARAQADKEKAAAEKAKRAAAEKERAAVEDKRIAERTTRVAERTTKVVSGIAGAGCGAVVGCSVGPGVAAVVAGTAVAAVVSGSVFGIAKISLL